MRRVSTLSTAFWRYLLAATLLLGGLLSGSLAGVALSRASAAGLGPLPPANPAADCGGWGLAAIDRCRAEEGIGPLVLPRNWRTLSVPDQLFVLIDLERVNRGLAPVTELLAPLNRLALRGARARRDPPFPSGGFTHAGGIYASADPPSDLEADALWMYADAGSAWGHRDIILMAGRGLVAGAGATGDVWDAEILAGYGARPGQVTFTWAGELRQFARPPAREPLARRSVR